MARFWQRASPSFPSAKQRAIQRLTAANLTVMVKGQARPVVVTAETGIDLVSLMPLVRVWRTGGYADDTSDRADIDCDCFAPDEGSLRDLTNAVRQSMLSFVGGGAFSDVTENNLADVDYGNPAVRRAIATYTVTVRALRI